MPPSLRLAVLTAIIGSPALAVTPTPSPTPTPTAFVCSRLTCDELGFPEAERFGDITVCGETDNVALGGHCSGATTWAEAEAFCMSAGARLCSDAELKNDEAKNSGCNYNVVPIWSSTTCDDGYKVAFGAAGFGAPTDDCLPADENATEVFVRCCADAYGCTPFPVFEPTPQPTLTPAPTSVASCSESTCSELGWSNGAYFGDASVCGETDLGLGGCSGTLSWGDAKTLCQGAGARLCTADELLDDEAAQTGCNYDGRLIWSSTSCGAGSYEAAYGGSLSGITTTICTDASSTSTTYARCCADTAKCTLSPTPVPTKTPTSSPTMSPSTSPLPTATRNPTVPSPSPTTDTPAPTSPSPIPTIAVACSVQTCDTLGWDFDQYGSSLVCGGTHVADGPGGTSLTGACSGHVTFAEAREWCEAGGARLCTHDELLADEARGTGCNYNSELVWSSTACGSVRPYKETTYYATFGATVGGSTSQCYEESLSTVAFARCCADLVGCTESPTHEPTSAGETPRPTHTPRPTLYPTQVPTHHPSHVPTLLPSSSFPTELPYFEPTPSPSHDPTKEPSPVPTKAPTHKPSHAPTRAPSPEPSQRPTRDPTHNPTPVPTPAPSPAPTRDPTHIPTVHWDPTPNPTHTPSRWPTPLPTTHPTDPPTRDPTPVPTHDPTPHPTHSPTHQTWVPTHVPTILPTPEPSVVPSPRPSGLPTPAPTHAPTLHPTKKSLCSEKTCGELGWDSLTWGTPIVCGASEVNGTCSGALGFEDARAFCQSAGARLCEAHELQGDDARDTGCKYNGEVVWSGSPCANNQRSYYVMYGSSDGDRLNGHKDGTFGRQCEVAIGDGAQTYPVRCCADEEGGDCSPSQAPTHIPTPLPTTVPTPSPTSSKPTPIPTPSPTSIPLTCASPSALYESLVGQAPGSDYSCSQVEVQEVDEGLAQRFCNFAPGECAPTDLWETCTFSVRSSALTVHAPPSYKFDAAPAMLFCTLGCTECLAK